MASFLVSAIAAVSSVIARGAVGWPSEMRLVRGEQGLGDAAVGRRPVRYGVAGLSTAPLWRAQATKPSGAFLTPAILALTMAAMCCQAMPRRSAARRSALVRSAPSKRA